MPVEALERRTLPGIERSPKAAAQRQRNYEKALEVLRLKKGMPLTHCYAAARLARADPAALVPLLLGISASAEVPLVLEAGGGLTLTLDPATLEYAISKSMLVLSRSMALSIPVLPGPSSSALKRARIPVPAHWVSS